jgi:hypothetical protein
MFKMFKRILKFSPLRKRAKDKAYTSGASSAVPSGPCVLSGPIPVFPAFSAPLNPTLLNPNLGMLHSLLYWP